MRYTLRLLRFFAFFSIAILVAVVFHPAMDPVWNYISSLEDEEYEFFSSISASPMIGDTIVLNRQPENNINITELNAIAKANHDIDTDEDGLYDTVEVLFGTDINNNDSDFDQLDDFFEVQQNLDPLNPDSNNDGISDYTETYNVSLDLEGDGVPNTWDIDNDGDGVTDGKDLSPFSKTSINDYFNVDIKTNGNPSFMDFQIRPKNPNHLTLPLQYWGWPNDAEGLMRDLDDSEEDVFILPYLEMSIQTDFKIISKSSGKCLEVCDANTSENATICQNTYNGADNQHWSILPVSEGFVKIINTNSEKCLAVNQSSYNNGAAIIQETFTGIDNQLWKLESLADSSYILTVKHSEKCLEIFNASNEDTTPIVQSTYSDLPYQQWIINDVKDSIPDQDKVVDYGISIELNKTLIPLTPIWDVGVVPAFNGKIYFPLSDPLDMSVETRLLWKVYGRSDTEQKGLIADNGLMVSANNSEGVLIANEAECSEWETFQWVDLGPDRVALKSQDGSYVTLIRKYENITEAGNGYDDLVVVSNEYYVLQANSAYIGEKETFEIVNKGDNKVALKAYNGNFVSNNNLYNTSNVLSATSNIIGSAETFTLVDKGYAFDAIPLVSYYEDFIITGFNFQENYGSEIGCFYNEDMNQTIKSGFVAAYDFLRNQTDLYGLYDAIQSRNITINSSVNSNLSHQDESIFLLMSQMLPQALHDVYNRSNDTIAPILVALQNYFTSKTLDDITSGLLFNGDTISVDVSDSPVITSKMFKMNWYNTSNISLLSTEDVLLESMRWGLQFGFDEHNDTLVMVMGLLNVWNMGEFRITSVGGETIQFNIAESPEVLNIIQYSVFSISSIIDVITLMTKFSKLATYRFLAFSAKYIKQLITPIANAIKAGLQSVKLGRAGLKALNALKGVVQAIRSSKAAQGVIKFFKSAKVLSFLDKLGTALIIIDLAITGVIAFYMFWSILFESGFSDFGAALGAWVVIFSFVYAGIYILLALALPVIGIILAILDMIFDFFGKALEWFLSLVTKTKIRSNFNLGFIGDPNLKIHDYDNNGLDIGDRIEFFAQIYGIVSKTSHGTWGDVVGSYVNPSLTLSVPEGSNTGSYKRKISTQTDGVSYRNETYDIGIWVDPISMSNFPLTIQLTYSYKRYYDQCVWFFGWWCDRESDSGTQTTDITTLYFDVLPGNLTSFLRWTELTSLDSDGDGLSDTEELTYLSNPWRMDTDGDGLWDKYEIDNGLFPYKFDSDNDGLHDRLETIFGTDGNKKDTDSDGLTDNEEYIGWDIEFHFHGILFSMHVSSDSLKQDTDNDGLSDLEEYMKGQNPRSKDTDADGILDPDEMIIPYQGFIREIDFNGHGSSIRVTPNATINVTTDFRVLGAICLDPVNPNPSNCSLVLTFDNSTGIILFNQTIYQGKPELQNMTENVTYFSFNASEQEGIYLVRYFVNWSCFGIIPSINDRELIGIIDVNVSGDGSNRWECYDLTGGDRDGDGISNINENIGWIVNYTDSTDTYEIHVTSDPRLIDTDGDGIWDIWEHNCFENSTNPRDPDTDNDGLTDWEEIYVYFTNPLHYDTDGDDLDDGTEIAFGSDPLVMDTDGDGLDDYMEFVLKSNPNSSDTDNDGLTDYDEYFFDSSLLNPDTDQDTLFDMQEFLLGTNPRNPDTDEDGLIDGYELIMNTDPKNPDTDDDGLNDYDELFWGTDPLQPDTDDDDLFDGGEIVYGTHPFIKDTDHDGIFDVEDFDTYAPHVGTIVLVYDLNENILDFEQHLKLYANVTTITLDELLTNVQYKESPYIVLVGQLDAGDKTVGNLSRAILEDAGENTTAIIESGSQFFASKNGIWNKTQTIVMLSHPHRLDHLIVLNALKTSWKTIDGCSVEVTWPTKRDSFDIEAIKEIDTMLWVYLEEPVIPLIKLTRYNASATPQTLTKEKGLDSRMSPTGIYLEINVSENVQNSSHDIIKDAWIIVYYTASDLDRNGDGDCTDTGDIREDTLSLYVFDETKRRWNRLSETMDWVIELGQNKTNIELYGKMYEGYLFAHVTHFSLYALSGLIRTRGREVFPPTATINVSDISGFVNTDFVFDGSKSNDDGIIESYHWDFGDGTNTTGMIVTYRFSNPGTYTVTLTVTDNFGLTDTDIVNVSVYQLNNPPSAPIITGSHEGEINTTIMFSVVSFDVDNDSVRYHINWGDGTEYISPLVTNNNPFDLSNKWDTTGNYTITVFAEDENNASSQTTSFIVFIGYAIRWVDGKLQGYFIDIDGDGIYDNFYNTITLLEIPVSVLSSGIYGLDVDGDDIYDHQYSTVSGKIEEYLIAEQDSFPVLYLVLLFLVLLLAGVVFLFLILKKNHTENESKRKVETTRTVEKEPTSKKQTKKKKN